MDGLIELVKAALRQSIDKSPHNFGEVGIDRIYDDAARAVISVVEEYLKQLIEQGKVTCWDSQVDEHPIPARAGITETQVSPTKRESDKR